MSRDFIRAYENYGQPAETRPPAKLAGRHRRCACGRALWSRTECVTGRCAGCRHNTPLDSKQADG